MIGAGAASVKTLAGPEMMGGVVLAVRRLAKEAPEGGFVEGEGELAEAKGEVLEAEDERLVASVEVEGADEGNAEALL